MHSRSKTVPRFLRAHGPATFLAAIFYAFSAGAVPNFPDSLPTGNYTTTTLAKIETIMAMDSPESPTTQLFLAARSGRIFRVDDISRSPLDPESFLDIASRTQTNGERGLLGFALHPQYSQNGYFYVFYCTRSSGENVNRVSRFQRDALNPLIADPSSEHVLFDQIDDASNHNGGSIRFGHDGYLYITTGDEGGGNDNLRNGQRIDKDLFAGLLRIDVDKREGNFEPTRHPAIPLDAQQRAPFSIPADNPLVAQWQAAGSAADSPLRLEFYAIGLRNPWQFTVDPLTGDLWLGDVGQVAFEEVNKIVSGGNYGWPSREGPIAGPRQEPAPAAFGALLEPAFAYDRTKGVSVTGGAVYRGSALPELYGSYIFADTFSNRLWALSGAAGDAPYATEEIGTVINAATFGYHPVSGELLIATREGDLVQLTRGDGSNAPSFPARLSETDTFADLATLAPRNDVIPYEINLPFWSDYAIKQRWLSLPEGSQIETATNAPWIFPSGSVFIKHFDLETTRGDSQTRKRIETRFIVKTEDAAYGLSYRWNDAQTDATLVPPEGVDFDLPIQANGVSQTQRWSIPSRRNCMECHTPAAGYVLSVNTRQLDTPAQQSALDYLASIGVLDTQPETPATLPRFEAPANNAASLEARARSYLAVNCVSCHQPASSAPNTWDARPQITLAQTKLVDAPPTDPKGNSERRLIAPGAPELSVLLDRLAARNGYTRMPPIGSHEIDPEGLQLLSLWTEQLGLEKRFAAWTKRHFGPDATPESAPDFDADSDGTSNRLEFLAQTDPLDPSSAWRPSVSLRAGESLSITFPAAPGRTYRLQTSDDLRTWNDIGDAITPLDSETQTFPHPVPACCDPSFMRLSVE